MNNSIKSIFFSGILFLTFTNILQSQVTDSLSLKSIIEQVVTTHPSVKAASEAINIADARIGLARSGYYPETDVTASFSNMGPVTKLTIPSMGTFQLFPENNYSASVNYRQMVYDFGRTRQNVEIETENKSIGEQSIEQAKQKLSLYAVNSFYSLLFLQAAVKIKEEQLITLNEHLQYIEKKLATGSATEYQLLATKVKISAAESQKTDILAAITAQQAAINSLTGNANNTKPVVKRELNVAIPLINEDSLLSYAYSNRDEVILNRKKESVAELRYQLSQLQNRPVINFQASAGAKNGYVPYLAKIKPNYVLGIGIRIPIYDGNKTKYNVSQAQSAVTTISYESEITKRSVSNEITEAEAYMHAAEQKILQFSLQLEQAARAYSLAETSFKSGVITNLDLLDANTSVSESRLMLLKSQIDYAASIYKLEAALGIRLY